MDFFSTNYIYIAFYIVVWLEFLFLFCELLFSAIKSEKNHGFSIFFENQIGKIGYWVDVKYEKI